MTRFLLTALTLVLVATPMIAMAQDDADDARGPRRPVRTVSVAGVGKVAAAPDVADINIGVVSQGDTAKAAVAANNEAMNAIQAVLKERGVAAKDVQTINISVQPRYNQPAPPRPGQAPEEVVPRIVGYEVVNSVRITARDITKLGTILDAAVETGANRIEGISFRIAEPEKLLDQARKQAMADAKRKAELLAGEAGVVLGPPISINEGGGYNPPRPMMMGRAMAMDMAAAPMPVAAGEQELSISVSVSYELRAAR